VYLPYESRGYLPQVGKDAWFSHRWSLLHQYDDRASRARCEGHPNAQNPGRQRSEPGTHSCYGPIVPSRRVRRFGYRASPQRITLSARLRVHASCLDRQLERRLIAHRAEQRFSAAPPSTLFDRVITTSAAQPGRTKQPDWNSARHRVPQSRAVHDGAKADAAAISKDSELQRLQRFGTD
jgi:hypothetical protein